MMKHEKISQWLAGQQWFREAIDLYSKTVYRRLNCNDCSRICDELSEMQRYYENQIKAQYETRIDLLKEENKLLIKELIETRQQAE